MKLSDRVRPDVEAAPWVIEEIKQLEAERDAAVEKLTAVSDALDYLYGGAPAMAVQLSSLRAERDALRQRLALAESVASAASAWSVAFNATDDDWDEWEALKAALKPWRVQRAIDTINIKAPVIQLDEPWLGDAAIDAAKGDK